MPRDGSQNQDTQKQGVWGEGVDLRQGPIWPSLILIWSGILGLILTYGWQRGDVLLKLPNWWSGSPAIVVLICLFLLGTGISTMWRRSVPAPRWRPAKKGVRFRKIVVYSKQDCPLCDEAIEFLQEDAQYFAELEVVEITDDPVKYERFREWIPVIEIDGRERFRGRVPPVLWHRLIEGTPPLGDWSRSRPGVE